MGRKIIRWLAIAVIAMLAVLVAAQVASAQDHEEAARKVKTRVSPVYPELARKMNVGGTVKVQITIEPNGSVKAAKALGGHPLLIEPSVEAAKKWKYEPAKEETTTVLQFNFNPAS